MIHIGAATTANIPRIIEIRHAAFSAQAPSAYSPQEVTTLLDDIETEELVEMIGDGQLFAARIDEELVGVAGWKDSNIRHVYVDPRHFRRKIATHLVAKVEADFRERTSEPFLYAKVALHAELFYAALGYRLVGRAQAWDGSAYLQMTKDLEPTSDGS